jgi:hypothetical protein
MDIVDIRNFFLNMTIIERNRMEQGAVHTMCFWLHAGKQSGSQCSNTEKYVIVHFECFGN